MTWQGHPEQAIIQVPLLKRQNESFLSLLRRHIEHYSLVTVQPQTLARLYPQFRKFNKEKIGHLMRGMGWTRSLSRGSITTYHKYPVTIPRIKTRKGIRPKFIPIVIGEVEG